MQRAFNRYEPEKEQVTIAAIEYFYELLELLERRADEEND